MDLTGKIFRISASMFITRTDDDEAFVDALPSLRNMSIANGFSAVLHAGGEPPGCGTRQFIRWR
ncbi:hypothetical protein [Bradyrhizobium sp. SRS-191]|uniref:hypothetical protein n=1 Tax=Bradyrhizobium sp. SRS-191 TaxID=2962606 RepID=UPI00211F2788|nr:hypothetical protein [Bradyrhizobium sp. SRS-191]